MNNKIIFFLDSPLSKIDIKRFGIDTFLKNGFDCQFFDFTKIYFSSYLLQNNHNKLFEKNTIIINNKDDIIYFINKISNESIIISNFFPNNKTSFLFKLLDKNNLKYGFVFVGSIPYSINNNDKIFLSEIIDIINNPSKLLRALKNLILNRSLKFMHNPAFIMYAGRKTKISYRFKPTNKTKLISCNSYDYDNYIINERLKTKQLIKGDYIVFIDQYLPYHPDISMNKDLEIAPETYYQSLNNYFNEIEKITNSIVVIAGHPRSEYDRLGNKFEKRKIILNETINLIKFSRFVITHYSTSISYAVLYKKYINVIYLENFPNRLKKIIFSLASELELTPNDISKLKFDKDYEKINDSIKDFSVSKYNSYVKDYITELAGGKQLNAEIFIQYLKNNQFE